VLACISGNWKDDQTQEALVQPRFLAHLLHSTRQQPAAPLRSSIDAVSTRVVHLRTVISQNIGAGPILPFPGAGPILPFPGAGPILSFPGAAPNLGLAQKENLVCSSV
jgi:hypothetical protein